MESILWTEAAEPRNTSLADVIYNIRREDPENLLMDSVTSADILADADDVLMFDALVVPYQQLLRRMNIMRRLMNRAGTKLKVEEDTDEMKGMVISDPFKKNGAAQVAVTFNLEDGQTISIFFHNPDATPSKIAPGDDLISWKWLLNKKDVTIVVAPEHGKDLDVHEVSRRIMKLADKNSAAFARANAKKAERLQKIEAQESEIASLEAELAKAKAEFEEMQADADKQAKRLAEVSEKYAAAEKRVVDLTKERDELKAKKEAEAAAKKAAEEKAAAELAAKNAGDEKPKTASAAPEWLQKLSFMTEERFLEMARGVANRVDNDDMASAVASALWSGDRRASAALVKKMKELGYDTFSCGTAGGATDLPRNAYKLEDDGSKWRQWWWATGTSVMSAQSNTTPRDVLEMLEKIGDALDGGSLRKGTGGLDDPETVQKSVDKHIAHNIKARMESDEDLKRKWEGVRADLDERTLRDSVVTKACEEFMRDYHPAFRIKASEINPIIFQWNGTEWQSCEQSESGCDGKEWRTRDVCSVLDNYTGVIGSTEFEVVDIPVINGLPTAADFGEESTDDWGREVKRLEKIIDGTSEEMDNAGLADWLVSLSEKYKDDSEKTEKIDAAADAWTNYAITSAQKFLKQ